VKRYRGSREAREEVLGYGRIRWNSTISLVQMIGHIDTFVIFEDFGVDFRALLNTSSIKIVRNNFRNLILAVESFHINGYVHCGLQPESILARVNHGSIEFKLKDMENVQEVNTALLVDTFSDFKYNSFVSPEVYFAATGNYNVVQVNRALDIFSLGLILGLIFNDPPEGPQGDWTLLPPFNTMGRTLAMQDQEFLKGMVPCLGVELDSDEVVMVHSMISLAPEKRTYPGLEKTVWPQSVQEAQDNLDAHVLFNSSQALSSSIFARRPTDFTDDPPEDEEGVAPGNGGVAEDSPSFVYLAFQNCPTIEESVVRIAEAILILERRRSYRNGELAEALGRLLDAPMSAYLRCESCFRVMRTQSWPVDFTDRRTAIALLPMVRAGIAAARNKYPESRRIEHLFGVNLELNEEQKLIIDNLIIAIDDDLGVSCFKEQQRVVSLVNEDFAYDPLRNLRYCQSTLVGLIRSTVSAEEATAGLLLVEVQEETVGCRPDMGLNPGAAMRNIFVCPQCAEAAELSRARSSHVLVQDGEGVGVSTAEVTPENGGGNRQVPVVPQEPSVEEEEEEEEEGDGPSNSYFSYFWDGLKSMEASFSAIFCHAWH